MVHFYNFMFELLIFFTLFSFFFKCMYQDISSIKHSRNKHHDNLTLLNKPKGLTTSFLFRKLLCIALHCIAYKGAIENPIIIG